jgi:nucleoside-diphosphate-sugar epimerase
MTGPDNALSIRDLVDKVRTELQWRGTVNWRTIPARVGEIFFLNSDPAKAGAVLGWSPKVDLDEGLRRTIELWRDR